MIFTPNLERLDPVREHLLSAGGKIQPIEIAKPIMESRKSPNGRLVTRSDAKHWALGVRSIRCIQLCCSKKPSCVTQVCGFHSAAVRQSGVKLKGDLVVACVVGETQGGEGTHHLMQTGFRTDMAVVAEPFGEGNLVTVHAGIVHMAIHTYGVGGDKTKGLRYAKKARLLGKPDSYNMWKKRPHRKRKGRS